MHVQCMLYHEWPNFAIFYTETIIVFGIFTMCDIQKCTLYIKDPTNLDALAAYKMTR